MANSAPASRDVLLQVADIERAATFYQESLGLTIFLRSETMIGLEAGAFRLFLERGPSYGPVFEFYVDDVDRAKTALLEAGCQVDQEDSTVPKCYVRDPFGLIFNIGKRT